MSLLQVKNLTKRFGGLVAVNKVDFEIKEGEIVGLIGPNGAGKTTLFNLISGVIRADEGSIVLDGNDVKRLPPYYRCKAGIGRTFQVVRPFDMTVLENIMVPALTRTANIDRAREIAYNTLEIIDMMDLAEQKPSSLTLAKRKRIEVGRALATNPKLLLLDEVLAGLNSTEVAENIPLIRKLRDKGITILFIEHLMDAMMAVAERVLVMDQGSLILSGTPLEVTCNKAVIDAYLGKEVPECLP